MNQKTNLYQFCHSNGFSLKEETLEGRLLAVLLKPKIIIKSSLDEQRKQFLVKKAIWYLLTYPNCQLAIFWDGEKQFFPL